MQITILIGLGSGLFSLLIRVLSYGLRVDLNAVLSYSSRLGLNSISYGLRAGLSTWLSTGLSCGLLYWLLFGLLQGVSGVTIEDQRRVVPNQGIRRSALNGLVFGVISTVIVGLVVGLSDVWYGSLHSSLLELNYGSVVGLNVGQSTTIGILAGLSAGLTLGLLNGGLAAFRHCVLRFLLWRAGRVPWNYARFLDFAAERALLRKVGGGYIFVHRFLLDYFAS